MVLPGYNLGNSQVSVNRTIGPTLVLSFSGVVVKLLELENQGSWDRSRASKVFRMMLKTRSHNNFPRQTAAKNIL